MAQIDENAYICPHCGYVDGTPPAEAYYLKPGEELAGRYMIGKVLGYGGFGITYIGFDNLLQAPVAIKEYFPSHCATRSPGKRTVTVLSGDASEAFKIGIEKFISEAKRLAQLQETDGVVRVFDCVQDNNTAYIIMEYLRGKTVKEMLAGQRQLPYADAKKIILRVLQILNTVHEEGIIHRDIAPDNIFITEQGEVRLLDFGAARYAVSSRSQTLTRILKAGYAPEEQYRSSGQQGPWTDVYSAAATFYRMITGRCPSESIERMIEDDIILPSYIVADIPESDEAALMKALAVRRDQRFQTADEFRQALSAEAKSRSKTVKQQKPGGRDPGRGADRKRMWLLITAAAMGLMAAAIGIFIFWFLNRTPDGQGSYGANKTGAAPTAAAGFRQESESDAEPDSGIDSREKRESGSDSESNSETHITLISEADDSTDEKSPSEKNSGSASEADASTDEKSPSEKNSGFTSEADDFTAPEPDSETNIAPASEADAFTDISGTMIGTGRNRRLQHASFRFGTKEDETEHDLAIEYDLGSQVSSIQIVRSDTREVLYEFDGSGDTHMYHELPEKNIRCDLIFAVTGEMEEDGSLHSSESVMIHNLYIRDIDSLSVIRSRSEGMDEYVSCHYITTGGEVKEGRKYMEKYYASPVTMYAQKESIPIFTMPDTEKGELMLEYKKGNEITAWGEAYGLTEGKLSMWYTVGTTAGYGYIAKNAVTEDFTGTDERAPFIPNIEDSEVTGLEKAIELPAGSVHPFTVVGAGADSWYDELVVGDGKWVPEFWSTNEHAEKGETEWRLKTDRGVYDQALSPVLYVFCRLYTWDGNDWIPTDTISHFQAEFTVASITPVPERSWIPGSYTASAKGFLSYVFVTVKVDEKSILSVSADAEHEAKGIGDVVAEPIAEAMLQAQSWEVDSISGATITCDALKEAAEKCLKQAEGASAGESFIPGTYVAQATGSDSDDWMVTVEIRITVDETSIQDVEVRVDNPVSEIWSAANGMLREQFMEKKSSAIDGLSGATVSSETAIQAFENCLDLARGD